jgi:hypothetical protein
MKTSISPSRFQQGNTLLVTVVITALIGLTLLAYLSLVQFQNTSNVRSQAWNLAIPVVEAGIEEALAHLNTRAITNGSLACDGWLESGGTYTMTRNLGDGFYSVIIANYIAGTTNRPIIVSRGYAARPTVLASRQGPFLATAVVLNDGYEYLGRGVRARTQRLAIFSKGLVAKDSIDMNGNSVATDSFDSMDPLYSTNGLYISTKTKDSGDVAVNASLTNSLNVGNASIRGRVAVGPGGTIAVGNQGSVGSSAWVAGGNTGIEPGWCGNDMNVSFDDVMVPFSGGFAPGGGFYSVVQSVVYPTGTTRVVRTNWVTTSWLPSGTPSPITTNGIGLGTTYTYKAFVYITPTNSSGTYYKYVLEDGLNYQLDSGLDGNILVLGNASVSVSSVCNVTGLTIEWGKHLNLYCNAPSAILTGNSTANSDGTANSFAFWGTTNCTSITLNGNASFTGTIYAPSADFVMNGSGNTTVDFIGASITKTARLNGRFNFHYDEALNNYGPSRGFIVASWNEMLPAEIPPASSISH